MDTFLVPSDAVRIFSKDNALNLAWWPNIFTKSLFKLQTYKRLTNIEFIRLGIFPNQDKKLSSETNRESTNCSKHSKSLSTLMCLLRVCTVALCCALATALSVLNCEIDESTQGSVVLGNWLLYCKRKAVSCALACRSESIRLNPFLLEHIPP